MTFLPINRSLQLAGPPQRQLSKCWEAVHSAALGHRDTRALRSPSRCVPPAGHRGPPSPRAALQWQQPMHGQRGAEASSLVLTSTRGCLGQSEQLRVPFSKRPSSCRAPFARRK